MEDQPHLSDPNSISSTVHPKHAAMLRRLSNRNPTKPSSSSSDDTFESTPSFLSHFSQSKLSIESSLSSATSTSDVAEISSAISSLEKLVAESSSFLPIYEVRTCLETIKSLKQTLNSRSSQITPKKTFSFKTKKPVTASKSSPETRLFEPPTSTFLIPGSPGFHERENEVLSKDFSGLGVGEFVISGLNSCEVRLKGSFRALFVHKLKNCKAYSGPVSGSVLIEKVEDCVFILASHQIRIHNAKRCDFYLRVRSRPIIEDCESVRFAPYCLGYDGIERDLGEVKLDEENGNWENVDDFKWLKGFQSPNWSVLPENERIGEVTILDSN